jgi:hypothetical protein
MNCPCRNGDPRFRRRRLFDRHEAVAFAPERRRQRLGISTPAQECHTSGGTRACWSLPRTVGAAVSHLCRETALGFCRLAKPCGLHRRRASRGTPPGCLRPHLAVKWQALLAADHGRPSVSEAIEVQSSSRPDEWGKWTTVPTTARQADGYTIGVWSDSHSTVTVEVGIGPSGQEVSRGENDVPPRTVKERRQGRAKTLQMHEPILAGTRIAVRLRSPQSNDAVRVAIELWPQRGIAPDTRRHGAL